MVVKLDKREFIKESGAEGGNGTLVLEKIADSRTVPANTRLYAHAKLEPGSSVGYHVHKDETEIYYILTGKGLYSDNGNERQVEAGDVTFTPDGQGHSLENIGEDVLEFMALVVKE